MNSECFQLLSHEKPITIIIWLLIKLLAYPLKVPCSPQPVAAPAGHHGLLRHRRAVLRRRSSGLVEPGGGSLPLQERDHGQRHPLQEQLLREGILRRAVLCGEDRRAPLINDFIVNCFMWQPCKWYRYKDLFYHRILEYHTRDIDSNLSIANSISCKYSFLSHIQCLGQSWYVSVDMQIHIFLPLIILPLFYYRKIGENTREI